MLVQVREQADPGCVFAVDAYAGAIGADAALMFDGQTIGSVRVVAAEVAEDRRSVLLTLEIPDDQTCDCDQVAAVLDAAEPALTTFYVTFGQRYARERHPSPQVGGLVHPDGWLTVQAPDEATARVFLASWLGGLYAMLYGPGDRPPTTEHYPRGELLAVRAEPDPPGGLRVTWLRSASSCAGTATMPDVHSERGLWVENVNTFAAVGYPVHYAHRWREWTNPHGAVFTDWQAACGAAGTRSGRAESVVGSVLHARKAELCRGCWPGGHHTRRG